MNIIKELEQFIEGEDVLSHIRKQQEQLEKKAYLCKLVKAFLEIEKMIKNPIVKKYKIQQLEFYVDVKFSGNHKIKIALINDKNDYFISHDNVIKYKANRNNENLEIKSYVKKIDNFLSFIQVDKFEKLIPEKIVINFNLEEIKKCYHYFLNDELISILNYSQLHLELNNKDNLSIQPKL